MGKFSRCVLYGHQLFWLIERDRLDAHFCRFGSGFVTANNVREALESNQKINQILTHYQMTLTTHTHIPVVEPLHLPLLEAQKSVPRFADPEASCNQ